jgi:hypothetical protein
MLLDLAYFGLSQGFTFAHFLLEILIESGHYFRAGGVFRATRAGNYGVGTGSF